MPEESKSRKGVYWALEEATVPVVQKAWWWTVHWKFSLAHLGDRRLTWGTGYTKWTGSRPWL